jgi:hypothetical protein
VPDTAVSLGLVDELRHYVRAAADTVGSTAAINPGHRVAFHWPPPPPSYRYHVLASDWSGRTTFEAHGETFDVEVATTPYGVFGRCAATWHEARGKTMEEMLSTLKRAAEPLFKRQFLIATSLGRDGRFTGGMRELSPLDLLKLLYCPDRDVAADAHTQIETHASLRVFGPSLVFILQDREHPLRRSAQWCVLDLFEDMDSFCDTPALKDAAVGAVKGILWDAEDDFARTVYKAGVVLGGHLPAEVGGPVLIECLDAPSRIGRRSAIHGLFHVVEWEPSMRARVAETLEAHADIDEEPVLRQYAKDMARDVAAGGMDHVNEPAFADER